MKRRVGLLALAAVAVLSLATPVAAQATPAASHYLPHPGDGLVFQQYVNVSGGFGNYSGYTESDAVTGYLNVTAVLANGTETASYVYLGYFQNTTKSYHWVAKGTFTFSAHTYRYVVGTDNQSGLDRSGVWFYTNSSATIGSTFSALNYSLRVQSLAGRFGLHHGSGGYVEGIQAIGTGVYARDDVYGVFSAAYVWEAYYDPATGYIIGYHYDEYDSDAQGNGFVYTDLLRVTSTTYTLTTAKAPPTYAVSFDETGVPASKGWTLVFDGTTHAETLTTALVGAVPNGTYLYAVRASGYEAATPYGFLPVGGFGQVVPVTFSAAGSSSGSLINPWELFALVAVLVVVVMLVIVYLIVRRGRGARALPRHSAGGQVGFSPPPPGPAPPPISLTPHDQPQIQQVVVKEVVKVNCQFCGSLIDSTAPKCPFCGATRT